MSIDGEAIYKKFIESEDEREFRAQNEYKNSSTEILKVFYGIKRPNLEYENLSHNEQRELAIEKQKLPPRITWISTAGIALAFSAIIFPYIGLEDSYLYFIIIHALLILCIYLFIRWCLVSNCMRDPHFYCDVEQNRMSRYDYVERIEEKAYNVIFREPRDDGYESLFLKVTTKRLFVSVFITLIIGILYIHNKGDNYSSEETNDWIQAYNFVFLISEAVTAYLYHRYLSDKARVIAVKYEHLDLYTYRKLHNIEMLEEAIEKILYSTIYTPKEITQLKQYSKDIAPKLAYDIKERIRVIRIDAKADKVKMLKYLQSLPYSIITPS